MRQGALTSVVWLALLGCNQVQEGAGDASGPEQEDPGLGEVSFEVSCTEDARDHIETGLLQLHHMMYHQARPHFQAAGEADEDCAMAHWGVAMSSFYPLWMPTPEDDLERGQAALARAREIGAPTEREQAYLTAAEAFFTDPAPPAPDPIADHEQRLQAWTEAQRQVHEAHPEDVDAAAFHGLAEVSYAQALFSPEEERDLTRERRVGALMEGYLEEHPQHPGLHHYLIHAYDNTELAPQGLEIARSYAPLAPETPHALHMPSHIFVRLGHWEETAEWNERSAQAALTLVDEDPHAMGHYIHALDYMIYGYLQLQQEDKAREVLERVHAIEETPGALLDAYGLAATQARFVLERNEWAEAAALEPRQPDVVDWDAAPAAEALLSYARGLGAARTGDLEQAQAERERIAGFVQTLQEDGDDYWAHMTEPLGMAVEAWILYEQDETDRALTLMAQAAEQEEAMDKHPVTPGEVLPVRELQGEMLLMEDRPTEAVVAYQASLDRTPNRRNALAGLERARDAIPATGRR